MIDAQPMCGITLIDSGGRPIDHVLVDAPFESLRAWCRRFFENRGEAAQARLGSKDEGIEYVYPKRAA